jgi:hypothetical protein
MKQRLEKNKAETRWCCFILSEDIGGKQLEKRKNG